MKRIGIVICNRYHTCGGGKCLRAFHKREGAFARYKDEDVQVVGYSTCGAIHPASTLRHSATSSP